MQYYCELLDCGAFVRKIMTDLVETPVRRQSFGLNSNLRTLTQGGGFGWNLVGGFTEMGQKCLPSDWDNRFTLGLSQPGNLDGTGKLRKIGGWGVVVLHGRAAKKLLPGEIQPTESKQTIFDSQPTRTKHIGTDR